MRADQQRIARRVDLTTLPLKLRTEIFHFVKGIRGPRQTEVTLRQIQQWCSGTPKQAVTEQVNELVYQGKLSICRSGHRSRCTYFYGVGGVDDAG